MVFDRMRQFYFHTNGIVKLCKLRFIKVRYAYLYAPTIILPPHRVSQVKQVWQALGVSVALLVSQVCQVKLVFLALKGPKGIEVHLVTLIPLGLLVIGLILRAHRDPRSFRVPQAPQGFREHLVSRASLALMDSQQPKWVHCMLPWCMTAKLAQSTPLSQSWFQSFYLGFLMSFTWFCLFIPFLFPWSRRYQSFWWVWMIFFVTLIFLRFFLFYGTHCFLLNWPWTCTSHYILKESSYIPSGITVGYSDLPFCLSHPVCLFWDFGVMR